MAPGPAHIQRFSLDSTAALTVWFTRVLSFLMPLALVSHLLLCSDSSGLISLIDEGQSEEEGSMSLIFSRLCKEGFVLVHM